MRPDERDLDDEIRGHLALEVQERVERGEDPEAARRAALREFGYIPAAREAMRQVWYSRPIEAAMSLAQDVRVAFRSFRREKGLSAAVTVTLALGIGANAAVFSVVRDVLLRPLVNRDADRLIYIRQSAPGHGIANTTFSIPEIRHLESRLTTVDAIGDFSTIEFAMSGLGEPRAVQAGVVSGSYFAVMGLRAVRGRLLDARDDGPEAQGAAVLTDRFWEKAFDRDPAVVGRTVRLGLRPATIVGVLEPAVPYPVETEIIANVVTSPHHLGATMVTLRTHRMTEIFGRLAPGATLDAAREELASVHAAMMRRHPGAYPHGAAMQVSVNRLADQIAAPARPVLIALLAAAALVFVIACSNVASLILARSIRREAELAVRTALGASAAALRRTLLAESVVACGAGAVLGVLLARPLVAIIGRYAARYSPRANEVAVDSTLLWAGVGLAIVAAVILAYVPRLPSQHAPAGLTPVTGGARLTPHANRRLRAFAVAQVALSFVLLAGAGMVLVALVTLQRANTPYDMRRVLAIDVTAPLELRDTRSFDGLDETIRRIGRLPGVEHVAAGSIVPWRDKARFGLGSTFAVDGYTPVAGEDAPHARLRNITPGFFATLGIPLLAGRGFTEDDRSASEPVVIVSESLARRMFTSGAALNGRLWWTDPVLGPPVPRRIVGVVPDIDDENVVPQPALTIYHPFRQMPFADRVFVHTSGDPYALVAPVTSIIHELSADQPVARPATLADVRAEVLAPERLNAFVLSLFGGVALVVAVVGVAGVLAFSVSARTRELGVRLAIGSSPRDLLLRVLAEGTVIVLIGVAAGSIGGYAFGRLAEGHVDEMRMPGALPLAGAALVLVCAAVVASLIPAVRAARLDVSQVLRSE